MNSLIAVIGAIATLGGIAAAQPVVVTGDPRSVLNTPVRGKILDLDNVVLG
jgi:hypothetical protein